MVGTHCTGVKSSIYLVNGLPRPRDVKNLTALNPVGWIEFKAWESGSSDDEYTFHKIKHHSNDPVYVQVLANGKKLNMEVDMGAALSIISDNTRTKLFPDEKLRPSDLALNKHQWTVEGNWYIKCSGPDQVCSEETGLTTFI